MVKNSENVAYEKSSERDELVVTSNPKCEHQNFSPNHSTLKGCFAFSAYFKIIFIFYADALPNKWLILSKYKFK